MISMGKYVFFNYGDGYQKCIINALDNDKESFVFKNFNNPRIKRLFSLHNAWPLNKKFEMLFKNLWFKRIMKDINVFEGEDVYFLLYESFHLTYSKKFLRYLKKSYPHSRLCYMFSNPVDTYNLYKVKHIKEYLDAIITFNKKDSENNNFLYCPLQPYKVPIYDGDLNEHSDLFFIGTDKGRLETLIKIFEFLSDKDVSCDFYIVGVPEGKQKYKDKIHYNQCLSYDEVLKKVASTNCVLELLQNSENYISVRTIEAMQYHTKLLTSNSSITSFDFYDENIIQVFDDVESIRTDFIKNKTEYNHYPDDKSFCSLDSFKQYLLENVK